jgi:DedD protein
MHRDFGGTVFEPAEEVRDREVTLGPMMLTVLALGLCALCAVFFVWGYSVGHRSPAETAAANADASGPSATQLLSGQSKPAASPSGVQPQADTQSPVTADGSAAPTDANAAPVPASYPALSSSAGATGNASVVQAALPAQPAGAQSAPASGQVQPAIGQGTAWMVQIAAVTHPEDADVLVSALRKRGYAVSSRRDPTDNLLHVQVGPFGTHADAASMRQRLLGDGYNAIIEP